MYVPMYVIMYREVVSTNFDSQVSIGGYWPYQTLVHTFQVIGGSLVMGPLCYATLTYKRTCKWKLYVILTAVITP
jgi:hypothetical protein